MHISNDQTDPAPRPMLSVVSPVYGCADCLVELASRLRTAFEPAGWDWELILVDDRGPDAPWPTIMELAANDSRIKGVRLARNHGQHLAIWAGLAETTGTWVAVIDCDLQDDPGLLPALLARAEETRADAVVVDRGNWSDNWFRRAASKAFYKGLQIASRMRVDRGIGNFGVYSRRLIDILLKYEDMEVFFPLMVLMTGLRRELFLVDRGSRFAGKSAYSFWKLLRLAVAVVVRFSDRPLKISALLGFIISALSAVVSVVLLVGWLAGLFTVAGWTSLMLSVWFLAGLILAVLGIHGIYLGRMFAEVQGRPRILIEERVNTPPRPAGETKGQGA